MTIIEDTGRETDPDGSPVAGASFDQRLNEARSRHGLAPESNSSGALDKSSLGLVARVGVELVAALAVGLAIGWGLDFWFKTRPLFLVVFVLLGSAAGLVNVWRLVSPDAGAAKPRD